MQIQLCFTLILVLDFDMDSDNGLDSIHSSHKSLNTN